MTYFWETVDTIAPGLGWPHFGPFHLAVLAVFLLLGAVLCRSYRGMDADKRRRWRRTVALLLIADELFKDFGLLYGGNFSSITCRCTCAPSISFSSPCTPGGGRSCSTPFCISSACPPPARRCSFRHGLRCRRSTSW